MKYLLLLFFCVFTVGVSAQTIFFEGLPSAAPQRAHGLAVQLDDCARTCLEPARTNAEKALNYIEEQFSNLDLSIADRANDTDELLIGEAVNALTDAVIAGAEQIASTGEVSPDIENITNNARSNVNQIIIQTGNNIQNTNRRFLGGFNGEGLFLEEVVRTIYDSLDILVFDTIYSNIGAILTGIFISIMALYLTWYFVKLSFGEPVPFTSFVHTVVSFLILITIIQGDFYLFQNYIAEPLLNTAYSVASWFVSQSATNLTGFPDEIVNSGRILSFLSLIEYQWARVADIANTLWVASTSGGVLEAFSNALLGGAAYALLVISFSFTLVMFAFQIIYAIVAAHLLLALAPIYILLYAFPATRGLFFSWIKSFFNYLIIPTVGGIAITITVFTVENTIVDIQEFIVSDSPFSQFPWSYYWALVIISLINGVLATRVGDISASLVGGGVSVNLGRDIMQSLTIVGTAATGVAAAAVGAKAGLTDSLLGGDGGSPVSADGGALEAIKSAAQST